MIWNTDGSQSDVIAKIALASAGDTVAIPAGSFTWGTGGTYVSINKAIILQGAGTGDTTIVIASSAPTAGNGTIRITANAVVKSFTITQTAGTTTAISAGTANAWRVTNLVYNSANTTGASSYFVIASSYGLIDSCIINAGSPADECILSRGPSDSWQTADSFGTANALYVEDVTWNNHGYPDFNSNSRGVWRMNTMTGNTKVDGHGLASNTPARGVRQLEIYNNTWTASTANYTTIEVRGGTAMIFNNAAPNMPSSMRAYLNDYGYLGHWPNFASTYQTPVNYPIADQIGVGMDPKTAASSPAYVWGNTRAGGAAWVRTLSFFTTRTYVTDTAGYAIGATSINLATGSGSIYNTDRSAIVGDDNRYAIATTISGPAPVALTLSVPGLLQAIPASATTLTVSPNTLYQGQVSNPTIVFTDRDIIQANRDFFSGSGFDNATGVQVGTKTQMLAYTPSINGYGWWVTNEGSWNTTIPANTSGQLYTWNGSSWSLKYTPYTYPHPLRSTDSLMSPVMGYNRNRPLYINF